MSLFCASIFANEVKLTLTLIFVLTFSNCIKNCQSARILSISVVSSKSHRIIYDSLLYALADRGHQVTIVDPIKPEREAHVNVRNIYLPDPDTDTDKNSGQGHGKTQKKKKKPNLFELKESSSGIMKYIQNPWINYQPWIESSCRRAFESSLIREGIMKEEFDAVIFLPLFNECLYGLVSEMKVPNIILMSQVAVMPWFLDSFGAPNLPSFTPLLYYGFSDSMNFGQRIVNFLGVLYFETVLHHFYYPRMENIYRELINPNLPPIKDIQKNVSLMLVNSHISLVPPRPLLPNVVEVGGLHMRPSKPLPQELDEFLTGSGDAGFILFSMGSFLPGSSMPKKYQQIFLNVFSRLKQRVLWKWETETMEDLPKNVKLIKWLPQPDVLSHEKIRMFITHGGHGGVTEAIYYQGVPLIGLPMFSDQISNIEKACSLGIALSLELPELTEEKLFRAIQRILREKSFREKAQKLSDIARDQIDNPLDRAVYHVEYVLKYNGAEHLRSAGRNLNFFQYYSLDVICTLIFALVLIFSIQFLLVRCVIRKFSKTEKSGQNLSRERKNK